MIYLGVDANADLTVSEELLLEQTSYYLGKNGWELHLLGCGAVNDILFMGAKSSKSIVVNTPSLTRNIQTNTNKNMIEKTNKKFISGFNFNKPISFVITLVRFDPCKLTGYQALLKSNKATLFKLLAFHEVTVINLADHFDREKVLSYLAASEIKESTQRYNNILSYEMHI